MKHFNKIPDDSKLPQEACACQTLVNLISFRQLWLNGLETDPGVLRVLVLGTNKTTSTMETKKCI
jgi:hypothetical protein